MIYFREINAKIQGSESLRVVFKKATENPLDRNALALIEKINTLAKANEKILVPLNIIKM
jgi:replication-associated recombination protein RarA